jgi:hypothetical protein
VQRTIADQVANVRRNPFVAGFNELIVVELFDIFLQRLEFPRNQGDQRI